MFERAGSPPAAGVRLAVALTLAGLVLPGCSRVRDVLRPSRSGTVDAHVVYRQREGCPALVARTLRNGYTVLIPEAGTPVDPTGIFEGPVREGFSVYRYYVPGQSTDWGSNAVDVEAEAVLVDADLPTARAFLDLTCGTRDVDLPSDQAPRRPDEGAGQ